MSQTPGLGNVAVMHNYYTLDNLCMLACCCMHSLIISNDNSIIIGSWSADLPLTEL